ncbi:hypothetical protein Vafri_21531, partial [Volvox africanus]
AHIGRNAHVPGAAAIVVTVPAANPEMAAGGPSAVVAAPILLTPSVTETAISTAEYESGDDEEYTDEIPPATADDLPGNVEVEPAPPRLEVEPAMHDIEAAAAARVIQLMDEGNTVPGDKEPNDGPSKGDVGGVGDGTSVEEMHDRWLGDTVTAPARASRRPTKRQREMDDDLGAAAGRRKMRGRRGPVAGSQGSGVQTRSM